MAKPGIMLYFDILDPIRVLPDADKGRLLVAMLEYGQSGKVPRFDGMLALAWGFVQPSLDRDDEAYQNSVSQRKYAAFCKQRAARDLPKIPFEEWMDMSDDERLWRSKNDNGLLRAVAPGSSRYPTTTSTTTPTTTSTTTPTTTSTTTPTATTESGGQESDFNQLWLQYPEDRRGSRRMAADAFRLEITSPGAATTALENLAQWMRSEQWTKDDGRYVPYLDNWLSRGAWKEKPKELVNGQARELDEDELRAIQRIREGQENGQ